MGGRGRSYYYIVKRLKNYKNAVIDSNKFGNYILNPDKDPAKARFFKSLGYGMKNDKRLEADIRAKLATNRALAYELNERGDREYQVNMQLGINKKAMVATAWIVRKGEDFPRFVTAYYNEKLEKRNRKNAN